MANIIKRVWNQNRMVQIEDLKGMTFQAEQAGHTFQISGVDDEGNTVALTGTPAGVLLRPDNTDVALTCSVSGGVVSATLPANCYDVPGRFGLTIFITSGSSKTAIYAAVGTVTRTSSGTAAPGTTQSVVDLINAINAAINSIPASYSALLADIAPTYSNSALYSVGQYTWYDGDLKRCIVPITTAESYTAAHWTSAVLGQDVSDLKSALNSVEEELEPITVLDEIDIGQMTSGKILLSTGYSQDTTITSYKMTEFIPVEAGKKYYITSKTNWGNAVFAFYTSNGTAISGSVVVSQNQSEVTVFTDYEVVAPNNAAKCRGAICSADDDFIIKGIGNELDPNKISALVKPYIGAVFYDTNQSLLAVQKEQARTNIDAASKTDFDNIDNMLSQIKGLVSVDYGTIRTNTLLRNTGLSEYNSNENFKATNFIDVTPGEVYYVTTSNVWGYALVCFYNQNGTCVTEYSISAENSGTPTWIVRYGITIPNGIYKIMLGAYGDDPILEETGYVISPALLRKAGSILGDKKITVIGDSITEHNYWAKTNWAMWLNEMTGCTIQNLGVSGSGFANLSPYINRISQIASDTDIIGVAVSFNDLSSGLPIGDSHYTGTTTICGYANDFFTALNNAFPTTPIICYSQGTWADIRPGIDYQGGNTLISEMKKICANHGIPYYFDMYEKGSELKAWIPANKTKYYKCDDETSEHYGTENGTHPNSLGHKFIANYLLSKFEENVLPQKL